jgi:hypothetical protein
MKFDFRDVGYATRIWIELAQDRNRRKVLVFAVLSPGSGTTVLTYIYIVVPCWSVPLLRRLLTGL